MKFSLAWADIASQNVFLKIALASMSLICIVFAISGVKLVLSPPLIIDRECYSTVAAPSNVKFKKEEIKVFTSNAIQQRFNTSATEDSFLSQREKSFRSDEQAKLKSSNMRQSVIVNEVTVNDKDIIVNADRVISVGEVRSAFPFNLRVELENLSRSKQNPYGLILDKAIPIKKEEKRHD